MCILLDTVDLNMVESFLIKLCALHVRASYKLISLSQLLALTIVAVGVKAKVKNVETELLDLTSAGRLLHTREPQK